MFLCENDRELTLNQYFKFYIIFTRLFKMYIPKHFKLIFFTSTMNNVYFSKTTNKYKYFSK